MKRSWSAAVTTSAFGSWLVKPRTSITTMPRVSGPWVSTRRLSRQVWDPPPVRPGGLSRQPMTLSVTTS
jgi:hypothetical protein